MKSELVSFDTVLLNNTIEKEMFYYETKLRARRVTEIFRGGGGGKIFFSNITEARWSRGMLNRKTKCTRGVRVVFFLTKNAIQ